MAEYQELWQLKDLLKADIRESVMGQIGEIARRQTEDLSRAIHEMLEQTAQSVLDEVSLEQATGPVLEDAMRTALDTQYPDLVQQAVTNAQYPQLIKKAVAAAAPEMERAREVFAEVLEQAVKEVIREAIAESMSGTM